MKESSTFQIVLLVVFGFFIIFAVIMFSVKGGKGGGEEFLGEVTVWGTVPERIMSENIKNIFGNRAPVSITYIEKQEDALDKDLVEALASGIGPDIILLPQNLIMRHSDKIYPIPYESLSQRDFKDRFVEEGELYLSKNGILALPFMIDPMIMYWNRDLFSGVGISQAPSSWDDFYKVSPLITSRGANTNIIRSTIAFGEFSNINHAKDILATLIMQAGNPIVIENSLKENSYRSSLAEKFNFNIPPTDAALRFYTEFSNPAKSAYSWNGSLPSSYDMFIAGNLAVYFGFASEFSNVKRKNPHLNFDIAPMPQTRDATRKVTFGKMQGLAILKASKNISAAFRAAVMLSDNKFISAMTDVLELPPVRRDLLAEKPTDAVNSLFYNSAIISSAWLDPSPIDTEDIFKRMVSRIVSGRSKVSESVVIADKEMDRLLK
jgi:ABC-type glycerol-3-phosphate transport system substrate-binding protein